VPAPALSFYFDLASPFAYLAAEQVMHELPPGVRWQPVLASRLAGAESFEAYRCRQEQEIERTEVERRASLLGLQPLRWPEPFPFDSELAMLAATYARRIGRVAAFAQAAFRQAFAGGHSLGRLDFVLIAAAACEMHPKAVQQATERASMRTELRALTEQARGAGVSDVPAIVVGERAFVGERALADASAHLSGRPASALGGR
jgi:2-hydroxychromene-2-carboxylate isomerase